MGRFIAGPRYHLFRPVRQVVSVDEVSTVLAGGINAYSSPHIDADISSSAYSGRLYIAFMDRRNGFADFGIWLTSSDNKGLTWTEPVRINDDEPDNGLEQSHPWLTVDNLGVVTVVWFDRRHDPKNRTYHCYISQSTNGVGTWSPNPVRPGQSVTVLSGMDGPGTLSIHDAKGRTTSTMANIQWTDGILTLPSEGFGGTASGIYFLRLRTPTRTSNGRLILNDRDYDAESEEIRLDFRTGPVSSTVISRISKPSGAGMFCGPLPPSLPVQGPPAPFQLLRHTLQVLAKGLQVPVGLLLPQPARLAAVF